MSEKANPYNPPEGIIYLPEDLLPGGYYRPDIDRDDYSLSGDLWRAFGFEDRPYELAQNILSEKGRVSILDAGCGSGRGLQSLKERVIFRTECEPDQIFAAGLNDQDFSFESELAAVRVAYKDHTIPYILGDIKHAPFADESFDIVYSYEVFLHNEVADQLLFELARVLKPDGSLFLNLLTEQANEQKFRNLLVELSNQGCRILEKEIEETGWSFSDQRQTRTLFKITKPMG